MLERRRMMMEEWAGYCESGRAPVVQSSWATVAQGYTGFIARLSDVESSRARNFQKHLKNLAAKPLKYRALAFFAGKRFCCLDSENNERSNLLPLPHRRSPRRNGLYRMPGRGRVRARKGLFRRSTGCSRSCRLPSTSGSTRIPIGRRLGCRRTYIRCAQCTCSEGVRESGGIQACIQDTSISKSLECGDVGCCRSECRRQP